MIMFVATVFATTAYAIQGDPLPGIDVSMEQNPGGIIISQTQTNGNGNLQFNSIPAGSYRVVFKFPADTLSARQNTADVVLTISAAGQPDNVMRFTTSWKAKTAVGIEVKTTAPAKVSARVQEGEPEGDPSVCLWGGAGYSAGAVFCIGPGTAFCIGPGTAIECLKPPQWTTKRYEPCASAAPITPR
jgi:hypothetical protein